jgi:hypothetical protein
MLRYSLLLTSLALIPSAVLGEEPAQPRVLLEVGRDYPETRLFSACIVHGGNESAPWLAVAGFSRTNHGDVAIYEITDAAALLQTRVVWRGSGNSSIRTLRAADLDGNGRDELIALGRAGDEEADSTGELQVFSLKDDLLRLVASASWQSGRYTHGYGMNVADLDSDGRPEIVTGGFFRGDGHEQAELRIWRFEASELKLVTSQSWGSESGDTRINTVSLGDVIGDGRIDIVAGGRTGQVHGPDETNQAEADQITVWSFDKDRLQRVAGHEGDPRSRSRFREIQLANIDSQRGLEILAAGRTEGAARETGLGTGGGGGRGTGGGGGRGSGGGGSTEGAIRPTLQAFTVRGDRLIAIGAAPWGDALGEVRDIAVVGQADSQRIVTILADDLKPQRQAVMTIWQWDGTAFQAEQTLTAALGSETRARQIVAWPGPTASALLTVGFVKHDDQLLGQLIRWIETP